MEQLYARMLNKYPDCPVNELPPLPKFAAKWGENEFEAFITSLGQIMPQCHGAPEDEADVKVSALASGEASSSANVKYSGTADACLVIPSQIYMEDRAPEGLKFEAILTKFDRCRAAALQSICGVNLRILKEEYGVGILLSDLSLCVQAKEMPALISSVDVESEIDLPKMPLVPSRQRLVNASGGLVCSAIFGQLLVDLATTRLSGNEDAYNRLKLPCGKVFAREIPNSRTLAVKEQLAAKLAWQWPARGRSFAPQRYLGGKMVIAPSDCDTYNTVYHPKVVTVCERACLSTGETFCCEATNAFFSRFLAPLPPGLKLFAHVFVERDAADGASRVFYIFEEEGKPGVCPLIAFAVYGGRNPSTLYNEEVQTVSAKNAQALMKWARHEPSKTPDSMDMSALTQPPSPL